MPLGEAHPRPQKVNVASSAPLRAGVLDSLRSAGAELGTCAWDRRGCQRLLQVSRRLTKAVSNSALKSKAEKAHPDEYRRSAKKYTFDDY